MINFVRYFVPVLLVITISSCKKNSISNEQDYLQWINKHAVKSKTVNGLELSVKYLPPDFLAYKELSEKEYSRDQVDSLVNYYSNSYSFLLTISPLPAKDGTRPDLLYYNLGSVEEYNVRLKELTFNFNEYVYLETQYGKHPPILNVFENTYGITPDRTIYLVFNKYEQVRSETKEITDFNIVFNDKLFVTGISYFNFKAQELNNVPKINFWK